MPMSCTTFFLKDVAWSRAYAHQPSGEISSFLTKLLIFNGALFNMQEN